MLSKFFIKLILPILTAALWSLSFPPFNFGELAYISFIPILLWGFFRSSKGDVLWVAFFSAFLSWLIIFFWLRHVTLIGTLILCFFMSLYFIGWVFYVKLILPNVIKKNYLLRILAYASIAGSWSFLEWVREHLFYGMPMGPLALSQWQKPVILQISSWIGAYGVSFFLVFFNCCIAYTFYRLYFLKKKQKLFSWFGLDFYTAILSLGGIIYIYLLSLPSSANSEVAFRFGVVQPNFPPLLVWDEKMNSERLNILKEQIEYSNLMHSDILFLPEAVTPDPIIGDIKTMLFIQDLVNSSNRPFLLGNMAYEQSNNKWYNGVFCVNPNSGISENNYYKRELVPFGEYVPFPFEGLVNKLAGIQGRFYPGTNANLIPVEINKKTYKIGALICYEDMFPRLARTSVKQGAEILYVATNDSWYKKEGAAYFHLAHSVLRAVENRRPIIRAGNAGWSGWIDSYGNIRGVLLDENNEIYFRGSGIFEFNISKRWINDYSFYTLNGDFFIIISFILKLLGGVFFIRPSAAIEKSN